MIITFYGLIDEEWGISYKGQLELVVQGLDQLVQPEFVALEAFPRERGFFVPGQELTLELDIGRKGVFLAGDVQDYRCIDLPLLVVFQLEIREQDLLERVLEDTLLLIFQSSQEMVDPQQDDFWRCLSILEAVLLSLRNVFSLYVEIKDSFCACHRFCQSNASFLSRPVFSCPFPFHFIFIHHPFQVIPQVPSDIPSLLVSSHQSFVSWIEVSVELFVGQDGSLEPRMVQHLLSRQPFLRISHKQPFNEILKSCRKRLHFSLEFAPKQLQFALSDQVVLLIGDLCVLKWRDPHVHQEQDNSSCKHIYLFTFIQEFMDLRRYVAFRPSPGLQEVIMVVSLCVPGKSEICQLDIEPSIEQDVLEFDVSVGDFDVFEVFKCCDQLEEKRSADILGELALVDDLEELPVLSELQHHSRPDFLVLAEIDPGLGEVIYHLHDVRAIDLRQYLYLMCEVAKRLRRTEIQLNHEQLVVLPCEEGLALPAISHRTRDGVRLNEPVALHK